MNETDATVVRLEGPNAWVQAAGPAPACGSCAQKGSCNTAGAAGILDEPGAKARKPFLLCLPNTIHARPGDAVIIHAADGMVLKAVWRAYGIPLLLALAGAMLAVALTDNEIHAIAAMLFGLFAGFVLMRMRGLDSSRPEPILSMSFKQSSVISVKGR
ncbi:MAG: SoxR reducing system RseC family protein [Pseudomonadota bacterium]